MDRFSDILGIVQKSTGSTFHSCEPELIELMRQIDVMVEEKRNEWESQMISMNMQLEKKTEENNKASKTIENTNRQVGILRQQLTNERTNHKAAMNQYNFEISKLKDEVADMRKKHERLLKKTEKFQTKKNDEKETLSTKINSLERENHSLKEALELYKQDRAEYQTQLEEYKTTINSNQALTEKIDHLRNQNSTYEFDINRQKQIYSNMEINTAKQIAQLKQELRTCKENFDHLKKSCVDSKIKKELEVELQQEKYNKNEALSKLVTLEKINQNLQDVLSMKDKKIKQLNLSCNNLDSSLRLNAEVLEKEHKKKNEQLASENVTYWENRVTRLENSLKEATETLDSKISEIQVCNSQMDTLRMENDHLKALIGHQKNAVQRENIVENSILGVTALETENNQLHLKLKELQQELASSQGTRYENRSQSISLSSDVSSVSSSMENLNIEALQQTLPRDEISIVQEFIERENAREVVLGMKLKGRINDFDRKCQQMMNHQVS